MTHWRMIEDERPVRAEAQRSRRKTMKTKVPGFFICALVVDLREKLIPERRESVR